MKTVSKKVAAQTLLGFLTIIFNFFRFVIRNTIDFVSVISPLPELKTASHGRKYLIFNWRDTKHTFAGGAEVYVQELAKRWVAKGHAVTIFCGNDGNNPRYEIIDGVEIIRRGGFYFVYLWALVYYVMKFRGRYDVIIDCENGIPFFTPLYAKEQKYLLIHHVHQEVFRKSLKPPFSWLALFLEREFMPWVYRGIQIVTVSESSQLDIRTYGLSQTDALVLHNGVDVNRYMPGEKSSHPLVLYVGRLKYYKSVHILLHAAKELKNRIPELRVIIAGSGEESEGLKKLAQKLKLTKTVQFLGHVSEEEKINLYQQAWVFVQPSFMEGWGSTNIEANACGTPVIASNVPGLRDSVQNPHTGFLVPYGRTEEFAKRIEQLVTDLPLRTKMSQKAVAWSLRFNWDETAQKGLDIFKP